jgi:hypothetical protein
MQLAVFCRGPWTACWSGAGGPDIGSPECAAAGLLAAQNEILGAFLRLQIVNGLFKGAVDIIITSWKPGSAVASAVKYDTYACQVEVICKHAHLGTTCYGYGCNRNTPLWTPCFWMPVSQAAMC